MFDELASKSDWKSIRQVVSQDSAHLILLLEKRAAMAVPDRLLTIDKLYGAALSQHIAPAKAKIDWLHAEVRYGADKVTAEVVSPQQSATMYVIKEGEEWRVDVISTLSKLGP